MLKQRLCIKAEPASLDLAMRDELVRHTMGQIAGDCSAQSKSDLIDANDLSVQVHQRSARVTTINRRIVPNPPHQRPDVFTVQPHSPKRSE